MSDSSTCAYLVSLSYTTTPFLLLSLANGLGIVSLHLLDGKVSVQQKVDGKGLVFLGGIPNSSLLIKTLIPRLLRGQMGMVNLRVLKLNFQ